MTGVFFFAGVFFGGLLVWASRTGPIVRLREIPLKLWTRLAVWTYARMAARRHFEEVKAKATDQLRAVSSAEVNNLFFSLVGNQDQDES